MRAPKLFLSVVISLCLVQVTIAQPAERVYGGLYQPAPRQPEPMRTWRLSERGELLKDFPESIRGRFIALHGATLVDECKMVLVQSEDGRRLALRFLMLSPEDRKLALDAHRLAQPAVVAPASTANQRPYAAVWREYSKETDAANVHTFESDHFLFFFGNGTGEQARLLQDETEVRRMKERAEEVWQFYDRAMHVDMPFARDPAPRKIRVYLLETGLAKHPSGQAHASNRALVLHPGEVAGNASHFAHEFVHVIQDHQGGLGRQGNIHEAHADWLSYQHNSSRGGKMILQSARFTDFPLFSWRVAYGYWPTLQYFSETYSPALCVDLLSKDKRDGGRSIESPLETLYRLGAERGHWRADETWSEFADVLTRAAAHKAYWDFIPQMSYLFLVRQAAKEAGGDVFQFTRKQPQPAGDHWMPKADRAPGQFGYHTIELQPSGTSITASVEKTADCDWRLIAVARDANWKCRYSAVVAAGQTLNFPLEHADKAWSLIVLAVPRHYRPHTEDDEQANRFARYSFKLKLEGAEPVGAAATKPTAKIEPAAKKLPAAALIERGAKTDWRYLDDGTQPPATWTSGGFDDGKWKTGRAPLGYGEPDVATEISFGGKPNDRHLAAYFRRSFDFAGDPAQVSNLALDMRIDDGVVVFLNGTELIRQNIPAGPTTVRTHTIWRVEGADEKIYHHVVVPATALQRGRNVLAAEVHQINVVSSDLFFDLQLTTTDEQPGARASAAARDATLAYYKNNYVPAGMRIPDGYVDGGHAMKLASDGGVASQREIIVVDRTRDTKLRTHLEYVRWLLRGNVPPLQRAVLIAQYVDQQYSPADGRHFSEQACAAFLAPHAGKEVLIGDLTHAGVCRHRSLVFKILADEAGLNVALVRGHLGKLGYHAWNELVVANHEKLIVDVMNPQPGYAFPKTTDRAAEEYFTVEDKPYYPKPKQTTASTPSSAPAAKPATGIVTLADDPAGRALLAAAQRTIAAYHDGHRTAKNVLRIVYFHPSDRDPLPNYAERLDRIMADVSDFYRDGLRRFAIASDGLPLERKDGRLFLHVVRGKKPASAYTHEDGDGPTAEIRAALKGTFDLDREHVLVIYGLCRKEPDGRYVFHAPYYGGGSQRAGLCHAADCELLDPLQLNETKKKIVYTEHYYPRMEQTVARFNSWYIGGIAHELGHGLGLEHDSGNPAETTYGTSLMGWGNHTYRQDVWGGGEPTFFSRVSALQLAAHPFVTGSDRGRADDVGVGFQTLTFSTAGSTLLIRGQAVGEIPPYAVVAYLWPKREKTDHGARTFTALLNHGAFELSISGLPRESHNLKLASLHANGDTTMWPLPFGFDSKGEPDVAALTRTWGTALVERAERAVRERWPGARSYVAENVITRAPTPEAVRKLRALQAKLER